MKIGAIQICSGLEPEANLKKIETFIEEGKQQGVQKFFLPECFYSMSDGTKPSPYLVETGNEHYQAIQAVAIKHQVYLLGGSAATWHEGQVVNRCLNFAPDGTDLGHYDKIHLFSCELGKEKNKIINESDIYTAGNRPKLMEVDGLRIGLSICFDVRYPQQYRKYALEGANTFSISSAFTVPTGRAHWETLVRARAIENQCFAVAAAQWGRNNDRIQTYGHSLIIDPWGEILADAQEGEKLVTADFDLELIGQVRRKVKVF